MSPQNNRAKQKNKLVMSNLEIFSKRLKQARIKEKLTMEELCRRTGGIVTKQTISKYEAGLLSASFKVQQALSTALNVSIDYLTRPFATELDSLEISFRKKANTTAKDTDALQVNIQNRLEDYIYIEDILGIQPTLNIAEPISTITSADDTMHYAQLLRNYWDMGKAAIANTFDLLEQHGVKVILIDAPQSFDGVSGIANQKHPFVVINRSKDHIERRRLTTLHELGHIILNNHFADTLKTKEKENLCNTFATEMLIPSDILFNRFYGQKKKSIYDMIEVSTHYGISVDAIVYRLRQLDIIGEREFRWYFVHKNKDINFKNLTEKNKFKERATHRYDTLVYKALEEKQITTMKASEYLGLTIDELEQQLPID